VLCATELSKNFLKSKNKNEKAILNQSRLITALLAALALVIAYISPQQLIYTLVSYVWAGIGCTCSVVILMTLFWKRFHGTSAVITIIAGISFTIIWISTGLKKNCYYKTRELCLFYNHCCCINSFT
jgi:Na+/proline symporter